VHVSPHPRPRAPRAAHLEERLDALLRGLRLETRLLLGRERAVALGLCDLVEDGLELDGGAHGADGLGEDVVLALHAVQPAADAEERLRAREVRLRLARVDEADRVQQLDAVRLALQLAVRGRQHVRWGGEGGEAHLASMVQIWRHPCATSRSSRSTPVACSAYTASLRSSVSTSFCTRSVRTAAF
jgi:hypothetical protein